MRRFTVGVQPHPDFFLCNGEFCAFILFLYVHNRRRRAVRHNHDDNRPDDDRGHDGYHNHHQTRKHNHTDQLCQNIYQSYHRNICNNHTTVHCGSQSGNGKRQGIRCR